MALPLFLIRTSDRVKARCYGDADAGYWRPRALFPPWHARRLIAPILMSSVAAVDCACIGTSSVVIAET